MCILKYTFILKCLSPYFLSMYLSIYYLKLATRYFCYLFYVLTDTEYR